DRKRGAQDLAGMGALWYLGLDGEMKPRDARLTLRRKDPAGGLLGPLALTEIHLGDVGQLGAPLIGGGSRGAGLRISNRPREVSRGATLDLRGELPEGWEAELYRGGVLVDFDVEAERGEYFFGDIPLYPGVNELEVVRHGPQGQRDETRRTVSLGADQPAPGKWYLEASALLQQQATLPIATSRGAGSELSTDDPDRGELASEARFALGLGPGFSLGGSLSTLSLEGRRLGFAGLSTDFFWRGFAVTLDGAVDQDGDWAAGGQLVASLGGFGIFLQHEEFAEEFRSPSSTRNLPLRRRSRLRARRSFDLPRLRRPLRTDLRTEYENGIDGASSMDFRLGVSTSIGEMRVHNEISGGWARRADRHQSDPLRGNLNLSLRRAGALRGSLSYSLAPSSKLRSVELSARGSLFDGALQVHPTLQHQIGGETSLGVGLGWKLPQVEMSTQLNADTTGSLSASLGLRFSLAWRGGRAAPDLDRNSRATRSLAYAQVFLDDNRDGERSPEERALAGVRFNRGGRHEATDERGSLAVSGLSELVPTDVLLDEDSLPDPFLRPSQPGYRVSARPGAPVTLLFPVVWVSDVEGTVLVTEESFDAEENPLGPRTRGLGNVEIVVLNAQGVEVRRKRSEFDGFFFISGLPSGTYTLRMDPTQATRFELDDEGGITVTLEDDTAILSGLKLHLEPTK
ncbi:MAG: hypothetical protein MI919_23840, partial [Holophagales bacterium]|nr:hypothetical protein [Holophagales bacterium]